ncbi:hypothetical protein AMECASPLE_004289 [Ameca splendens]|uniref:Uncharacterized protein n=1 Tax=Ameca splendens TaxID=208324 RepID=A0ABV0XYQ2_9TELE
MRDTRGKNADKGCCSNNFGFLNISAGPQVDHLHASTELVYRQEAGYTLDRSPIHHRTTQRHTGQSHSFTHSFTLKGNLERPVNLTVVLLDCGSRCTQCTQ